MRSRKKRIAFFLVAAFIMQLAYPCGNTERAKVKATDSNPFYEDELHNYKMLPYSVDLSGENTVATGGAIEIKKDNFFKNDNSSVFFYYQSIKLTYEMTFRDASKKVEELNDKGMPEEAWNFDTIEFYFRVYSSDGAAYSNLAYGEWINKSEQSILLNHENYLYSGSVKDSYSYFDFSISVHNADDGSWPLGVQSIKIKSIEFIPYENACYGSSLTTPKPTERVYGFACGEAPETPKPLINTGKNNYSEKGFSIDLSRYQTEFTHYDCWIDLRDVLNADWYRSEDYTEIRIKYKILHEALDEFSKEYDDQILCKYLCIQPVFDDFSFHAGVFYMYGYGSIRNSIKRPTAKLNAEQFHSIDLSWYDGKKVAGVLIYFRDKNGFCSNWHKEVKSITITGIDFIAKNNTVTPTATVTPTIKPTATATPTIKPTTGTTQIKSSNLSSSTPAISVPQKVTNLKLKAGKKKQIKISWNNQKEADGYEIYRSTKKNKGYQKIAEGFKNNCSFTDSKVKYAKNYYYKVRAYNSNGKNYQYGVFSDGKKLMLKRKAPVFKLKRKITTDGIHYISVRLKSCSDPYLQMWVRFGKKKYKKIPLSKHKIKKNTALNFKYTPGKGKISFRIRSYRVQNKKRVYSKSKTKRI